MRLLVGITNSDLSSLLHAHLKLSCSGSATVFAVPRTDILHLPENTAEKKLLELTANEQLSISASGATLRIDGADAKLEPGTTLKIVPSKPSLALQVDSLKRWGGKGAAAPRFHGNLFVIADGGNVRIVLETELDSYLKGVLQSEIPPSYEMEAIKAQAVTARTYALRPRIEHTADHCNVCDSYLCCQYFGGLVTISARHEEAIDATHGQILTYEGKPILALFSSCAGGHTEDYENCFSDPKTGQFPPPALPYLRGVAEGQLPSGFGPTVATEQAVRALWAQPHPDTDDAWSAQFKWSVHMKADDLESHMHNVVSGLMKDPATGAFVQPPPGGKFGHIKKFAIAKRGVAGTAIVLSVSTSAGDWLIIKELVIRSAFKLPPIKLARLKSARIFFDHAYDQLGLLTHVDVHGLGFGHGVGLQQTGAQGLAKQGADYRKILTHYFQGAQIQTT